MSKGSSQREIRPIWNNVQRMNHQNQFVPKAVLIRTGKIPVNTARTSGKRKLLLSPQQVVIGDPKDITRTKSPNTMVDQVLEIVSLSNIYLADQDKMALGHMTRNKAYLAEYQDFNGGPVTFGGSKGYITGKGMCDKKIQKGKQHKASCKAKSVSSISQPLQLLHMDLFGPTSVRSLNHKTYCLVITDDFSKFSWGVFLRTKNRDFIKLCGSKGIKREYSNARTPQQNGVAEIKNMTLIEATRTMLADSFLQKLFGLKQLAMTCYVLNRFDGKSDEGFLVGYSLQSKAFRVYNLETKRVEENLHITFLENKPNVAGKGPTWLFDLDYLTDSMNYQPVRLENQANKHAGPKEANHNVGTKDNIDAGDSEIEAESAQDYFVLPIWSSYTSTVKSSKAKNAGEKEFVAQETKDLLLQAGAAKASSTNIVNTASTPVCTASPYGGLSFTDLTNTDQDDSEIPALEEIYNNPTDGIFTNASYDDEGAVADFTNLETIVNVSPIPTSRINSIHPSTLILGDPKSAVQTRSKVTKSSRAHAFVSYIQKQRRNNHKDFQHCLFACFLSQNEPKKISEALEDESWVDAMQEELLQFKIQKVYRNKKDERGVVVRNKERLVAQGHRQEEGIEYDEVFAPVARIEAIRIFLAFASDIGFIVYQMDVKSAFLYGKIDEEVYVSQPPGFIDPKYPKKNGYRRGTIDKTLFIKKDKHDIILMSSMGELTFFLGLQVKQKEDGIFISQDKYVAEILKKFNFVNVKTTSTSIETQKPLVKDEEASDVDVHLYRSMIGSLMYLTAFRPDIMFATIMATSTTEAEYVAVANCCGQVLWIQNQMFDYGFNFMNTKIYIDNESTICIVKNLVFHSKTKHIAIRHHFIRDAYEKKLIQVLKIHTDDNVADLLTRAFDVSRFQFLVVTIGMINP
ncbi:putative ribonuclease H-like domain-containing protein [Tanacetum coccineum]